MNSLLSEDELALVKKYEKIIEEKEADIKLFHENKKKQEKILAVLKSNHGVDKNEVMKYMPHFIDHLMKVDYPSSIQVVPEEKFAAYIR